MKKRYLPLLLLGLSLSLTSCGPVTRLLLRTYNRQKDYNNYDINEEYDYDEDNTSTDSIFDEYSDSSELKSCTVDNISFSVNASFEPVSGAEGSFTGENQYTIYQLQGVSSLGKSAPEDAFQKLVDFYSEQYNVTYYDSMLTTMITQDNAVCEVGRIEVINQNVCFSIDVLICEQKNKVITYAAQYLEGNTPATDIRDITNTTTFQIGSEDYVSGNTFTVSDGSELCLNSDGSFIYYQYSTDHEGPYYAGTYEVYYGQNAIDKIVSMDEYGVTEEELNQTLTANMAGYIPGETSSAALLDSLEYDYDTYHVCKDTFYAIILHNEELVEPEYQVTTLDHDTLYFGHYIPELELVDLLNANTANYTEWKFVGKTN